MRGKTKTSKFRTLRNDIAHHKFTIRDDGEIIVYNDKTKNWEEIPLLSIHGELMDFASDMFLILWESIIIGRPYPTEHFL